MKLFRSVTISAVVALLATALTYAPASAKPTANVAKELGRWSEPFWEGGNEPYDPPTRKTSRKYPVAAALMALPDGRVMYWNALEGMESGTWWVMGSDGNTVLENARVRLIDVLAPELSWATSDKERGTTDEAQNSDKEPAHDLFCSDQKLLWDGTALIAGGAHWDMSGGNFSEYEVRGLRDGRIFDPKSNSFRNVGDMAEPRWYPSLVTLADGTVLVASGVRRLWASFADPQPSFGQVRLTEIYDPSTEKWENAGESEWSFPLYPRLHLLPDGKVFYGATGQSWNPMGETADQAMWSFQRLYDTNRQEWITLGHSKYGMRSGAAAVMLRLEPPYDRADILIAGGISGSAPGTVAASTLSEVVRWTPEGITSMGEPKSPLAGLSGDTSQLRNPRWFGVPVMLPTGEVFLVNGGDADDVVDPGSAGPVRTPEIYDPVTDTWTELASAQRDRVYHHSAVLLADGRVLVGGHSPHPAHYFQHGATVSRRNDFKDATFEIYEPPYLFRGDRPVVDRVIATGNGSSLRLILGNETEAKDIAEVVLVRMGSNTHSMDGDQRAVKLAHRGEGNTVSAELPRDGDGRILPPGPYYVFAMRDTTDGPIPSVGKAILVQPAREGRVVARVV